MSRLRRGLGVCKYFCPSRSGKVEQRQVLQMISGHLRHLTVAADTLHIAIVEPWAFQKSGAYVLSEGRKVSFDVVTNPKNGRPAVGNIKIER